MRMNNIAFICLAVASAVVASCEQAGVTSDTSTSKAKSPSEIEVSGYPNKVLWGDTHLHSSNSADAFSFGTRVTPADAYRFARGDAVISSSGQQAKLKRPLDFLVVADHAEGLGISNALYDGYPAFIQNKRAKRWHDMLNEGGAQSMTVGKEMINALSNKTLPKPFTDPKIVGPLLHSTWRRANQTAEDFNNPGTFTTLIGYEYTSVPNGNNLHRVVVFRDGADKTNQILPFSAVQSDNPEKLWAALAEYENKTGGQVLAIPHNSNVSNGRMFSMVDFNNEPLDADYASRRARWEPLVEITQFKGDSESHPFLSPNDEFSGFGDAGWDLGNLSLQELKTPEMLSGDYVREGLKRGLIVQDKTGVNPFKYGVIGSTDSHTGLSTGREDNFFGKHANNEPQKGRISGAALNRNYKGVKRYGWQYLAGGYAGVWARKNTREEIWDALKRKEVYGTTGPRMQVRFFGGGRYETADLKTSNLAKIGYAKGVPMGGDLKITEQETPSFLVAAIKDPDGANLDRIQIIKGWRDQSGVVQEKVYDVGWAGNRQLGKDGKLPAIGSTVDIGEASYTNTIGATELTAVWKDPNFNPSQPAFYYVRVLQIPTPRWPVYDMKRFNEPAPKDAILVSQERAYTSPIWYTPQ